MSSYESFIAGKLAYSVPTGLVDVPPLSTALAPFQADLVVWALRRGRAAILAATGLGKTRMQLEWARHVCAHTGRPVLVLAPLAVAQQTADEARVIGAEACVARDSFGVHPTGITITNYDRLHKFDPTVFAGVVLDESSIIKHHDAKTLQRLIDAFGSTPYKLCATATPAPNDYTELGTHAEFLGVCSREEMLAEYFCHDGGDTSHWRLKGHARGAFWRWVASWGALVRAPSDLGYEDGAYALPPLVHHEHILPADQGETFAAGLLFAEEAATMTERRAARRQTISKRVGLCAELVNADEEPWIVWCELNDESKQLTDAIDGAREVKGTLDIEEKERLLIGFARREFRVVVTKPRIAGFGLNWQHASHMAFVGVNDSFESYFQALRRSWRFGQKREVHAHVFASELEGAVVKNLRRKEADAMAMAEALSVETAAVVREQVYGLRRAHNEYAPHPLHMPGWMVAHA